MKRSYYFARRIPIYANEQEILPITPEMSVDEIQQKYAEKHIEFDKYIHTGPWILRPIHGTSMFAKNNFPANMSPPHIWDMVRKKIESSDALIATINSQSYGTIAEAAYATGLGTIAVYVLPDLQLSFDACKDLWLVFQLSTQTQMQWRSEDFLNIPHFREHNILSQEDYVNHIKRIIPDFLAKP